MLDKLLIFIIGLSFILLSCSKPTPRSVDAKELETVLEIFTLRRIRHHLVSPEIPKNSEIFKKIAQERRLVYGKLIAELRSKKSKVASLLLD